MLGLLQMQQLWKASHKENIIENKAQSPKNNKILFKLIMTKSPGLVLFTSGTTGKPKAVLHNFDKVLQKIGLRKTIWIKFYTCPSE